MSATAIAAGVMAGLSILGDDAANRKIEDQANMNFNATLNTLDQQYGVGIAGLKDQAGELRQQVGMQLTELLFQRRGAEGQVSTGNVERNIYGQTAAKSQAVVSMNASLAEDQIIQSGEAAAADIGSQMRTAKYQREAGIYSASNQRAQAMSNIKSTFEIATGALKAGIGGASSYNSFQNSGGF